MLIYNEAILGNLISSDTHLENRAASYSFNIQDINVLFINVHLLYNESHDKGRSYSNLQKIEELMSTQGSDLK